MLTLRGSAVADGPRRRGLRLAWPLLVFGLLFATDACAYLDPGTGSVLIQGTIAATAAVVTWASLSWQRAVAWLRSIAGRPRDSDDEASR